MWVCVILSHMSPTPIEGLSEVEWIVAEGAEERYNDVSYDLEPISVIYIIICFIKIIVFLGKRCKLESCRKFYKYINLMHLSSHTQEYQ